MRFSKLIAASVSLSVCWIALSTVGVTMGVAYALSCAVGVFFFYAVPNEASYRRYEQQRGLVFVDPNIVVTVEPEKKARAPAEEVIEAASLAYAHDEIELYHHEIAVEWALADGAAWPARGRYEELEAELEQVRAEINRASGVPAHVLGPEPVRPDPGVAETYMVGPADWPPPPPHWKGDELGRIYNTARKWGMR